MRTHQLTGSLAPILETMPCRACLVLLDFGDNCFGYDFKEVRKSIASFPDELMHAGAFGAQVNLAIVNVQDVTLNDFASDLETTVIPKMMLGSERALDADLVYCARKLEDRTAQLHSAGYAPQKPVFVIFTRDNVVEGYTDTIAALGNPENLTLVFIGVDCHSPALICNDPSFCRNRKARTSKELLDVLAKSIASQLDNRQRRVTANADRTQVSTPMSAT
ncbi:MAG: hypothetical protein IKD70_07010 [Eggerthellaceae bacterium]|nr:hypothetical protein [Eggerthellaceae bacterium]